LQRSEKVYIRVQVHAGILKMSCVFGALDFSIRQTKRAHVCCLILCFVRLHQLSQRFVPFICQCIRPVHIIVQCSPPETRKTTLLRYVYEDHKSEKSSTHTSRFIQARVGRNYIIILNLKNSTSNCIRQTVRSDISNTKHFQ